MTTTKAKATRTSRKAKPKTPEDAKTECKKTLGDMTLEDMGDAIRGFFVSFFKGPQKAVCCSVGACSTFTKVLFGGHWSLNLVVLIGLILSAQLLWANMSYSIIAIAAAIVYYRWTNQ